MRYGVLLLGLLLSFAVRIPSVGACGGGAPFNIGEVADKDMIVRATVLEVDGRGYNAILQVHEYFKGNGGEYLAVVRHPAALEYTAAIRDYDTSCLYSGGGEEWIVGSKGYFSLNSNDDGTFDDDSRDSRPHSHFFDEHRVVEFYRWVPGMALIPQQPTSLPVAEFEDLLLSYGNRMSPVAPQENRYPLMRFLTITTESGQRYRLNPDRSLTPLDDETDPIAISKDGSHVVFRLSDNELGFQYLSLEKNALSAS